ncbi:hypothetical protein P8C59_007490 [Phyllachora maydis]|uniref:FAR1 domain-containing protein n=1 Tax=Phyllachora maydis TaxID=1825666 RepID=A0AAD9IAC3_9PEZI|nr:hypothetical protein P8C59_007490 [Phyllachora maydis]
MAHSYTSHPFFYATPAHGFHQATAPPPHTTHGASARAQAFANQAQHAEHQLHLLKEQRQQQTQPPLPPPDHASTRQKETRRRRIQSPQQEQDVPQHYASASPEHDLPPLTLPTQGRSENPVPPAAPTPPPAARRGYNSLAPSGIFTPKPIGVTTPALIPDPSGGPPTLFLGPYETREEAYHTCQEFAIAQGFFLASKGTTRAKSRKSNPEADPDVIRVMLQCEKAGKTVSTGRGIRKRVSNRTDCPYRLKITRYRTKGDKWYVSIQCEEHNHELKPGEVDKLASYRRYRRVQAGGASQEPVAEKYARLRKVKVPTLPAPPTFHTPAQTAHRQPKAPLHLASQRGQDKMVALLLDKGAELNARDATGQTPLHCAVDGRKESTITLLIERGADLACRDARGLSPLHLAIDKGYEEVAIMLMERGADPNV